MADDQGWGDVGLRTRPADAAHGCAPARRRRAAPLLRRRAGLLPDSCERPHRAPPSRAWASTGPTSAISTPRSSTSGRPRRRGMAHRVLREVAPGDPDPRRRGFEQGRAPEARRPSLPALGARLRRVLRHRGQGAHLEPDDRPELRSAYGTRLLDGPRGDGEPRRPRRRRQRPDRREGPGVHRALHGGGPPFAHRGLAPRASRTGDPKPRDPGAPLAGPRGRAGLLRRVSRRRGPPSVGLRAALEARGRGVIWYCSDNGPEHGTGPGSTGGLRGRKRDLYEGGIRVPAALWWCGDAASPSSAAGPSTAPRAPWTSSPRSSDSRASTSPCLGWTGGPCSPRRWRSPTDSGRDASARGSTGRGRSTRTTAARPGRSTISPRILRRRAISRRRSPRGSSAWSEPSPRGSAT